MAASMKPAQNPFYMDDPDLQKEYKFHSEIFIIDLESPFAAHEEYKQLMNTLMTDPQKYLILKDSAGKRFDPAGNLLIHLEYIEVLSDMKEDEEGSKSDKVDW